MGHIVEDAVSEELNNDNEKTEVSNNYMYNYEFFSARFYLPKYATSCLAMA